MGGNGCDAHAHADAREETETSQSSVIEPQREAGRSEIAERDDRMAIRINAMNEPTAGADQPNENRQAEQAILAAIEKGVPLSLACCRTGVSYEFFFQWRKDNPEFESGLPSLSTPANEFDRPSSNWLALF